MQSALTEAGTSASLIRGLCVATTSCTVLACAEDGRPLRPAIMWCDARAATEAEDMMRLAENDPALAVCCGGKGPVSAEWMIPKAMWLKWHEQQTWSRAAVVCEAQDWLNFKLTGEWMAGGCNVATRWFCDGVAAVKKTTDKGWFGGRPTSLLRALDLEDLGEKWPKKCVAMGGVVGKLCHEAQSHLGLSRDCVVVQGGADAFVALVAAQPEGGCLVVTGSSHLHLASGPLDDSASGGACWGPYRGAPLADQMMAEGGQSSTGSVLRWAQHRLFGDAPDLAALDAEAAELPVGAEGIVALETFQGARTPVTDPHARGCLVGLSLAHTKAHVWRAFLEAIALGTRSSLAALDEVVSLPSRIRFCGGATKSKVLTQMHADAANVSVAYDRRHANLVVAGAAALAAAHVSSVSIARAAALLLRDCDVWTVAPKPSNVVQYDQFYDRLYVKLAPALAPLVPRVRRQRPELVVSASVLAADAGALRDDAVAAYVSGASWIHLDVCDGSDVARGALSGLGPASVRAIREALPEAVLDVHLATADPSRHIQALAEAGASRITFQREAVATDDDALALAREVRSVGCDAGVSIAPGTNVRAIDALLAAKAVDLVDVLAVEPGRGGQPFQHAVLEKVRQLRAKYPWLLIQIDGGIDDQTAPLACQAGVDVLAAGSFVFPRGRGSAARSSHISDAIALLRTSGGRY